jgi:uncharacterized protein
MSLTRIFLILLCLLVFSACADKKVIPPPITPDKVSMEEAQRYWERGNYTASQRLYQKLSTRPDLSPSELKIVWQRLSISAYHNRDFESALPALRKWAELDPLVRETWPWQEKYSLSLMETAGKDIYHQYLAGLSRDMTLPFEVRKIAGLTAARALFEKEMYLESMSVLEQIYAQAPDADDRMLLEQDLREYIKGLSLEDLEAARPFLKQERISSYPYNVFFWSLYSRQLEEDPSKWEELLPELTALTRQGEFADLNYYLSDYEQWTEKFEIPVEKEIVLLLPLSGQFSSSGWKILRGAGIAHQKSLPNGLQVRIINTQQEGWLQKLRETDPDSITGGPVSREVWNEITAAGLHEERVFFTFLPSINDEGVSGWRFFASPRDQVRIMIHRSVNELGITDFAVFYPDDEFGRSFAEIFWQEATKIEARISGLKSYPAAEPERWNNIVASFLNVQNMDSSSKVPSPDFQAVFIPDSLSRVKGLIPQFFYFDQNQLLFMGPMLWSQAYVPDTLEQQYFSLSVTTGAWLDDNPSPAASKLKSGLNETLQGDPDFWVALGYDFVRFAAGLNNLPSPIQYQEINHQLAGNSFTEWSMAPVSWDEQGKASQDLHVLQMNRSSLTLADMDYLNSLILIREARKAHWIETLMERDMDNEVTDLLLENNIPPEPDDTNTGFE